MSERPSGAAQKEIKGWVQKMAAVSGQWSSYYAWVEGNMMAVHKTEVRTFMPQFKVMSVSILTFDKKNGIYTFVVTTSEENGMEAMTFKVAKDQDFSEWYSVLYNNCYASINEQALMDKADAVGRFTDLLSSGNKELDLTAGMLRYIREKFPSGGDEVDSFLALVAEKKRQSSFGDRFRRDTKEQKDEKRWGKLLGLMRETPSVRITSGMNELGEVEEMLILDMEYFPACTSLMLDYIKFNEVANAPHVVNLALRSSLGNVGQFGNVEKLVINKCETFDFSNVYKLSPRLTHLEVHSFLSSMNSFLQDFSPKGMLVKGEVPWQALRVLDVSHNQIKKFPKSLKELIRLEKLIADYNELSELENLEGLKRLAYFSARNNYLSNVAAIAVCPQLTYLDLDNNNISDFPWTYLPNLQKLGISHNKLSSWRDVYVYSSRCDNLKVLDIDNESLKIAIDSADYKDMLRVLFGSRDGLVVDGRTLSVPDKSTVERLQEKYEPTIFYREVAPNQRNLRNDGATTASADASPSPSSPLLVSRTVHKKLVVRKKVRRGGSKKTGSKTGSKKDSHRSVSQGSQTDGDPRADTEGEDEVEEQTLRDVDLDLKRQIKKKKHRRVNPDDKCAEWQKNMDIEIAEGGMPQPDSSPKADERAAEEPVAKEAVADTQAEELAPEAAEVVPAPEPEPVHVEEAQPEPELVPEPEAEVVPKPEPVLEAERTPTPEPELSPEPAPEPEPEAKRVPTPEPAQPRAPTPEVVRVPTPEVIRVPTPEVIRVPTPEVVRVPTPEVIRVPTPEVVRLPTEELYPEPESHAPAVSASAPQAFDVFASSKPSKGSINQEVDALSFSSSSAAREPHVNFDIPEGYESGASNEYLMVDEEDARPDDLVQTQTRGSPVEGVLSPELQEVMRKLGAPAVGLCQWWSGGILFIINWYKKYWANIGKRSYADAQKVLVVLCHFHLVLIIPFAVLFITVPTDDDITFRTFIAVMMLVSTVFQTVFGIMALFYENIVMLISFNLLTLVLAVRYIFNMAYYLNDSKSEALIIPPVIEIIYEIIYLGVSIVVAPNFNKLVCYRVGGRPHIVAMYRTLQVYSAAVKVDFLFITLSAIIAFFYYCESTVAYVLTGVALFFSMLIYMNSISWAVREKRQFLLYFSGFSGLVFCAQAYMIGYLSESSSLRSKLEEALHATMITIIAAVVIKIVMFVSLAMVVRDFGKGLKESLETDKRPEVRLWGMFPAVEL